MSMVNIRLFFYLKLLLYWSNVDKIREFIKHEYVERRYAGGKSTDKPPRDVQAICPLVLQSGHVHIEFN